MIAEGLGKQEQARDELKQALEINPHFHPIYADAAQLRLAALEKQSKSEKGSNQHGR
jgi:Tfp pilus assembly protein PilF